MTARLLDGKRLAEDLLERVRKRLLLRRSENLRAPCLAVLQVGQDPASSVYVTHKKRACATVGIQTLDYALPEAISTAELRALIIELNDNPEVDGILLQLPLPSHLSAQDFLELINPIKDVDGFHPYNMGKLAIRNPVIRPCTPFGVMQLLEHHSIALKGANAVVVGASNIVGRPMALELLLAGSTVTILHRFTQNLSEWINKADILISATGKPNLIQGEWIKEGAVVVDVGIHRTASGALLGDIDFEEAKLRAAWITPVPGGVGPMTVATLMLNTLHCQSLGSG